MRNLSLILPLLLVTLALVSCSEAPAEGTGATGPSREGIAGSPTIDLAVPSGPESRPVGGSAIGGPVVVEPPNPCGDKPANPCGDKPANPCGDKPANPCGDKAANPCGDKPANPCGDKAANPCGDKPANPCGDKAANPCGDKPANPCGSKMADSDAVRRLSRFGPVFVVRDPMKRDTVTFRSSAPLEDIVGTTNDVEGALVFDPDRPEAGFRGEFTVPVASLKTGIPLRDEHLRGPAWLSAGQHPSITFRIERARDFELVKEGPGFRTFDLTLDGQLTLHGKELPMVAPARVTFMAESEKTRARLPGDLLAGRASFSVRLADFGIEGMKGVVGQKVGEVIDVDVSLVASRASSGETDTASAENPCSKAGSSE
jgi:polyisoprenoid-binding protein YceI